MARETCEVPRCDGKADGTGRCWRHRGSELARKVAVAPSNPKRRAKSYTRNFGQRADVVRLMECLVHREGSRLAGAAMDPAPWPESWRCSSPGGSPCDPAHTRARGMGGAKGDRRHLVPLCRKHHDMAGEYGTSQREEFERRFRLDLTAEAVALADELDRRGYA